MWCIIENTNTCSIFGGEQMNALDELRELANETSRPADAAAFILCILEDLIKPEQLEQRPRLYPEGHSPKDF